MKWAIYIILGVVLVVGYYGQKSKTENVSVQLPENISRFYKAVKRGDQKTAESLLGDKSPQGFLDGIDHDGPIYMAARAEQFAMASWLIDKGFDVSKGNKYGETPLHMAVAYDEVNLATKLIAAGADVNADYNISQDNRDNPTDYGWLTKLIFKIKKINPDDNFLNDEFEGPDTLFRPMYYAYTGEMVALLFEAGANLQDVENNELKGAVTTASKMAKNHVTSDHVKQFSTRIYGTANPELMSNPFWLEQVRTARSGYGASEDYGETHFKNPIWSFDRFGKSITALPDGRWVEIAGEHEDFYDEDFCIYNDVIVHSGDGQTVIFGYPKDVFPPTDFHTATLVGDSIYIIGRLAYMGKRSKGVTPVYKLSLNDFSISKVDTKGDNPGWIYDHSAELSGTDIIISKGQIWIGDDLANVDNAASWALDLGTAEWRKL